MQAGSVLTAALVPKYLLVSSITKIIFWCYYLKVLSRIFKNKFLSFELQASSVLTAAVAKKYLWVAAITVMFWCYYLKVLSRIFKNKFLSFELQASSVLTAALAKKYLWVAAITKVIFLRDHFGGKKEKAIGVNPINFLLSFFPTWRLAGLMSLLWRFNKVGPGSMITNGREPRSCLGWVFNSKLGCFATHYSVTHATTSKVENSAQGSSCKLKFVHGGAQWNYVGN